MWCLNLICTRGAFSLCRHAEHSQQARPASQLDDRQPDFTIWLELGWTVEQHCRDVKINIATKCQGKKKTGPLLRGLWIIVGAHPALSCQVKCFRWKLQKQYSTTHNNTGTIKTQWLRHSRSLLHNINMMIPAGWRRSANYRLASGTWSHLISNLLRKSSLVWRGCRWRLWKS